MRLAPLHLKLDTSLWCFESKSYLYDARKSESESRCFYSRNLHTIRLVVITKLEYIQLSKKYKIKTIITVFL